jgi:hypothetical protein
MRPQPGKVVLRVEGMTIADGSLVDVFLPVLDAMLESLYNKNNTVVILLGQ